MNEYPPGIMGDQTALFERLRGAPRVWDRSSVLRAMTEALGNAGFEANVADTEPGEVMLADEKGVICNVVLVHGQFQITPFWGFVRQPISQIVPCNRLREALDNLKHHPDRPDYRRLTRAEAPTPEGAPEPPNR